MGYSKYKPCKGCDRIMKTSSSVDRALDIVELIMQAGGSMSVNEISKTLGFTRVTAYSMLGSLVARNYLERDPATKKYSVGYKFMEIGNTYRYNYPFLFAAEKHVDAMAKKWQLKINICVFKPPANAVVLLSKDISLIPNMRVGYVLPCYATASGKILMANLPEAEAEGYLAELEMKPFTARTITDKSRFLELLPAIKQQGYAEEICELAEQHCCIAAPVLDQAGTVIASVSFSGAQYEVEKRRQELVGDIVALAKAISAELGYSMGV